MGGGRGVLPSPGKTLLGNFGPPNKGPISLKLFFWRLKSLGRGGLFIKKGFGAQGFPFLKKGGSPV